MPSHRVIFRHHDPQTVEAVWLAIRAMEYPARLADAQGPLPMSSDDAEESSEPGARVTAADDERMPTHVEVLAEHFDELRDVIDEIVDEQDELDRAIEQAAERRRRRQRTFIAAIVVVAMGMLLFSRAFGTVAWP